MRKLVTLRKVQEVLPIEGADKIELVKIDGWQCVSGKGNFIPGDLAIFFEIDSFVPVDNEIFSFLEPKAITWKDKRGARIKSMKLRGELSQGLLIPLDEAAASVGLPKDNFYNRDLGEFDFSEQFGVEKWEPDVYIPGANLSGKSNPFPYFIPKTDEERIQNLWSKLSTAGQVKTFIYKDGEGNDITVEHKNHIDPEALYEVSIKLDGSSMTAYYNDGKFGVCSRNLELLEENGTENAFWNMAQKYELKEKLTEFGCNIAFQGELIGPGVNGNNEKLSKLEFRVFKIFMIDDRVYADTDYRINICKTLEIPHVPVLETRKFDFDNLESALKYAEGPSLTEKVKREGVVFKSLSDPAFSFKIISNDYLLKHGDRG